MPLHENVVDNTAVLSQLTGQGNELTNLKEKLFGYQKMNWNIHDSTTPTKVALFNYKLFNVPENTFHDGFRLHISQIHFFETWKCFFSGPGYQKCLNWIWKLLKSQQTNHWCICWVLITYQIVFQGSNCS